MIKEIIVELSTVSYYKYLKYLFQHKWYVGVECFKEGLYWQGLVHDLSKLLPSELIPYARHFHGPERDLSKERGKTGYKKPVTTSDPDFDTAWMHHLNRNPHHVQYWVVPQVGQEGKPFPMPLHYIKELICDWKGARKVQGNPTPIKDWYLVNRNSMVLHPRTKATIELLLEVEDK